MIANINYKGEVSQKVISKLKFSDWKPRQCVVHNQDNTIVFFKTGNCRIMGCKEPINEENLLYKIKNIRIQSLTVVDHMGKTIDLNKLSSKIIIFISLIN